MPQRMSLFMDITCLNELEQELRALSGEIAVIFRDDDVTVLSPQLKQLMEIFEVHNVPLHLGVVPAHVTLSTVHALGTYRDGGARIEIGQHGFSHADHSTLGKYYEFGKRRSYAQQLRDIEAGRERMACLFADGFSPVFSPPYHHYDRNTLCAVAALGFSVFSDDGIHSIERYGCAFRQVSVNLDPIAHYVPRIVYKPFPKFAADILQTARATHYLGFVLHHDLFTPSFLCFLQGLLSVLSRQPGVRFYGLTEYAREVGSSPPSPRRSLAVVDHVLHTLWRIFAHGGTEPRIRV